MPNPGFRSNLAAIRAQAGLTQELLATRAGVSRQALGLIEASRSVPSTALALKLAALLGKRVEDLFDLGEAPGALELAWVGEQSAGATTRGRVALVGKRWVAHPLDPRDVAAADVIREAAASRLLQPQGLEQLRGRLLISGCAPALGILVEHLQRGPDPVSAAWIHATTGAALAQLAR